MSPQFPFHMDIYRSHGPTMVVAILIAVVAVVLTVAATTAFRRQLASSRGQAALLLLVSLGGAITAAMFWFDAHPQYSHNSLLPLAAVSALPMLGIPFVVGLHLKWIGGRATEAEKRRGADGFRAWLSPLNVITALLIAACAWIGFGYSFVGVLGLLILALVAYPVLNLASAPPAVPPDDRGPGQLSSERERVMRMLDEGRITAEEGAELLNALGNTVQPRAPLARMVLIGAAILLIGFFLPWFTYNPGREIQRTMEGGMPGMRGNMNLPDVFAQTVVSVAGGDVRHGLGWIVLVLGVAAAALPYLGLRTDTRLQSNLVLIVLSAGLVVLLYLLTQNLRYASIGIFLAVAGYVVQLVGVLKERLERQLV